MSDTPMTEDRVVIIDGNPWVNAPFVRGLERELNEANSTICQQQLLDEEILRLNARIKRLEEFANRFLSPEDLGYSVNACMRDAAREALGMEKVETKRKEARL